MVERLVEAAARHLQESQPEGCGVRCQVLHAPVRILDKHMHIVYACMDGWMDGSMSVCLTKAEIAVISMGGRRCQKLIFSFPAFRCLTPTSALNFGHPHLKHVALQVVLL